MNAKRFLVLTISLILAALIAFGAATITVDPLFQYHLPLFGLKPVITNERYQNAGIAKRFDFETAIIGNSLSENFRASEFSAAFGGETVKLTAAGSHTKDWTYTLDILAERPVKRLIFNLDPYILQASPTELKHDLPIYLYDKNPLNDVNYLFNFSIAHDFTYNMLKANRNDRVPDYDSAFMWNDEVGSGKEFVLSHYVRPEVSNETDEAKMLETALANIENLIPYIDSMKDVEFIFFFSPFSMLFWDQAARKNELNAWHEVFDSVIDALLEFENVSLFLWTDEMYDVMGDLEYYTDEAHYSPEVSSMIAQNIAEGRGLITKENSKNKTKDLFDYLSSFNFDSLLE